MRPSNQLKYFFIAELLFLILSCNFRTSTAQQLDPGFKPTSILSEGEIYDIEKQPDGKVILAGNFQMYGNKLQRHLVRINQDGTIDESFETGTGFTQHLSDVAVQSDGKILVLGYFATFNGQPANNLLRLNSNGSIDHTFNIGTGFDKIPNAMAIQSDGKILFVGNFSNYNGTPCSNVVRLNGNGTIDNSFAIGSGASGGFVYLIKVQSDGKIIVGGSFTSFSGVSHANLCRLNSNGTIDSSLNAITSGTNSGYLSDIAVQSDGKIIVAGSFTTFNGVNKQNIVRLNINGSVDNNFTASTDQGIERILLTTGNSIVIVGFFSTVNNLNARFLAKLTSEGELVSNFSSTIISHARMIAEVDGKLLIFGFDYKNSRPVKKLIRTDASGNMDTFNPDAILNIPGGVNTAAIQKTGKIIVGGGFLSFNGSGTRSIVRINRNGSIDNTFNIGAGPDSYISKVALQDDDKILAAGLFLTFQNQAAYRLVRLTVDGTLDKTFTIPSSDFGNVNDIEIQKDGKIILSGSFPFPFNGLSVKDIFRIHPDGSLDPTFNIGQGPSNSNYISSSLLQPDGKIIIFGFFTQWNGKAANNIVRLNSDGSLDDSFNVGSGPEGTTTCAALASDGKIYIGGYFKSFAGRSVPGLTRINSDGSMDYTFNPSLPSESNSVTSLAIQHDGKILASRSFSIFGENVGPYLFKLNPDGSQDPGFVFTGPDHQVNFIFNDIDQRIIFSGIFNNVNGSPRIGMAAILPALPMPPIDLKAAMDKRTAKLTWKDNSDNEVNFILERSTGSPESFLPIATVMYNITSFEDHNLTPGTTYSYRVKSVNSAGSSSYATVSTSTLPFPAPTALSAGYNNGIVNLLWQDNTDSENRFVIERSFDNVSNFLKLDSVGANVTTYTHLPVYGRLMYYRVRAAEAQGYSLYSNTAQIDVITGIEYSSDQMITIQYNSTTREFNVSTPWKRGFDLMVFDILGRSVYHSTTKNETMGFDLSSQPRGIYIVKASSGENSFSRKISK